MAHFSVLLISVVEIKKLKKKKKVIDTQILYKITCYREACLIQVAFLRQPQQILINYAYESAML